MAKHLNPNATHPERAAQAWMILVGYATQSRRIKYTELAMLMYGRETSGLIVAHPLEFIARYCSANDLPPLTAIVVGANGLPGDGFNRFLFGATLDEARELVFDYAWFDVLAPSPEELQRCHDLYSDECLLR